MRQETVVSAIFNCWEAVIEQNRSLSSSNNTSRCNSISKLKGWFSATSQRYFKQRMTRLTRFSLSPCVHRGRVCWQPCLKARCTPAPHRVSAACSAARSETPAWPPWTDLCLCCSSGCSTRWWSCRLAWTLADRICADTGPSRPLDLVRDKYGLKSTLKETEISCFTYEKCLPELDLSVSKSLLKLSTDMVSLISLMYESSSDIWKKKTFK